MEPDQLFTLKNHFFIGNYQVCVREGSARTRAGIAANRRRPPCGC